MRLRLRCSHGCGAVVAHTQAPPRNTERAKMAQAAPLATKLQAFWSSPAGPKTSELSVLGAHWRPACALSPPRRARAHAAAAHAPPAPSSQSTFGRQRSSGASRLPTSPTCSARRTRSRTRSRRVRVRACVRRRRGFFSARLRRRVRARSFARLPRSFAAPPSQHKHHHHTHHTAQRSRRRA